MELKRLNIISEILAPLKKIIFRNVKIAKVPTHYYDVTLLKCLYSLAKNDTDSSNFYMDIFKASSEFSQEEFDLFRNLVHASSIDLNVPYDILLSMLIEKEKRNFSQQSMIVDFLKDTKDANDSRLTTLLRRENIIDAFQFSEILFMDKMYTTYFINAVHQH